MVGQIAPHVIPGALRGIAAAGGGGGSGRSGASILVKPPQTMQVTKKTRPVLKWKKRYPGTYRTTAGNKEAEIEKLGGQGNHIGAEEPGYAPGGEWTLKTKDISEEDYDTNWVWHETYPTARSAKRGLLELLERPVNYEEILK